MKKIGIILHDEVINNKTYKILNTDFIKYLSNYDVVIIGIIYDEETDINKILEQINICDGIIIPGGNIYSDIDKRVARYLYDIDKPTLGICLGMQIMGEALGGKIEILDNLKSTLINKNNMVISSEDVQKLKNYTRDVKDITKTVRSVNDLNMVIKDFEHSAFEIEKENRSLKYEIELKDNEIVD